jgi:hypothetical protein
MRGYNDVRTYQKDIMMREKRTWVKSDINMWVQGLMDGIGDDQVSRCVVIGGEHVESANTWSPEFYSRRFGRHRARTRYGSRWIMGVGYVDHQARRLWPAGVVR